MTYTLVLLIWFSPSDPVVKMRMPNLEHSVCTQAGEIIKDEFSKPGERVEFSCEPENK